MITLVIILLTIINFVKQECLEGCLKCNSRDECLFCDGTNNYILDGLTCKKIALLNCLTINIAGNCLTCEDNYFLNQTTKKCQKIDEGSQLENCMKYKGPSECFTCKKDFMIENSVCKAVANPIEGCSVVDSEDSSKCLQCEVGYISSLDKKTCLIIAEVPNCGSYSFLECVSCKDNYVTNKNIYIDQIYKFNDEIAKFVVLRKLIWDKIDFPDQGNYDICKKIEVKDCIDYISYNECNKCKPNFFKTEQNTCVSFPTEQIMGCLKYFNANTCTECETGKFLQDPQNCIDISPVANCISYNASANKTICLSCDKTHYLDEKSNCIQRTELSDFLACFKKDPYSDSCLGCDTGLEMTSDKLACLNEVSNCINYTDSDKNTSDLVCKKCKEGMFYNNSLVRCEAGTVSNCELYEDTADVCVKCINQYYLKSNQCLKHSDLFACTSYSGDTSKTCLTCGGSSYKFSRFNGCNKANSEIENCEEFVTGTICKTCALDYFVNNVGSCDKITAVPSCRKVKDNDNNKCSICKEEYFIKDGLCVLPQDFFISECESNNINGLIDSTQTECNYCYKDSIPLDYKDNYICVSPSTIPNDKIISDCLKYHHDISDDSYSCTYCDNNYNIPKVSTGSCIFNCSSSDSIVVIAGKKYSSTGVDASTYNRYQMNAYKKCIAVTPENDNENCIYSYPHIFSSINLNNKDLETSCVMCKDTFFATIKQDAVVMVDDPEGPFILGRSVLSAHPGISCKAQNIEDDYKIEQKVENCEYYHYVERNVPAIAPATGTVSVPDIRCYRCKIGYHGIIINNAAGEGKVNQCVEMTSCDITSQIRDGGLLNKEEYLRFGTALSSYFSCYKCKAVNHIPIVALTLPAFDTVHPFPKLKAFKIKVEMTVDDIYSTIADGVPGKNIECYDITSKDSFGIELPENYKFPDNCALGYIDVESKAKSSKSKEDSPEENTAAIQCIACLPGFKPLRHQNVSPQISRNGIYQCEAIGNSCSSSTWFNACSECRSGHIYNYNTAKKFVDFTNCIVFADSNCFAAEMVDGVYKCRYCKKGFSMNLDKVCEVINAPKCIVGQMNFKMDYEASFTNDQFNLGMYLTPKGAGCHKCFGGYIGLKSTTLEQKFICTKSDYVKSKIYVSSTLMINNCTNYIVDNNNKLICKVCEENFIPSTNGKCIPQSNSANCVFFKGEVICQKCKEGYIVISGICEEKNIQKCIIFEEGELVEAQNCIKCDPDYYPSNQKCVKGIIDFCEILSGPKTCEKCLNNYTKVVTTDATDYCYPISPELNCKVLDEGKFSNLEVNCKECDKGYALSTNSLHFNNTICMNFRHYDNCEEYDIHSNIEQSSFKCRKCLISHYLDENKLCVERQNRSFNCVNYVINADMCQTCEEGFYVGEDGFLCTTYPSGIQGCVEYENEKVCLSCKKNMYLSNNKCIDILEENKIDKCLFYEGEKICKKCDTGYAVEDISCVIAQALNCSEYQNKITCLSCPEGYGFKEESGIKNCVEKNITKCVISENFYPFVCLTCAKDFYPDKGKCVEVLQTIKDCQIYIDGFKCLSCMEGTTLSSDKKECLEDLNILALLDPQCKESKIGVPKCMTCKKGYIMDKEGNCVVCTQSKIEDGCYNCDPTNQNICIICAPGFYQTKESECKKSSDIQTGGEDGDKETNTEDVTEVEYTRVLYSFFYVLFILYFS